MSDLNQPQTLPMTTNSPKIWPTTEMPPNPVGSLAGKIPLTDGEGFINETIDFANSPVKPPADGKGRILIGIPLLDIKYEFFESFMKFWTQLCTTPDLPFEVGYQIAYRKPVHMAEEHLVNVAKFNKCTHLLLMDDDIYDTTLDQLMALWNAKKDIISGVMYASKFPHAMCVFRRYDINKRVIDMPVDTTMFRLYEVPCICSKCGQPQTHWDGKFCTVCGAAQDNLIQEADLTPFPFTLIDLKVFDKIKYPWFHCTNTYPTDSWFADRVLEAGLRLHAHMGVRLNHAGISDATKPFYMQMGLAKAQTSKAVCPMSQEEMDKHQQALNDRMLQAEHSMREKPGFIQNGAVVEGSIKQGLTLMTHGT